MRAATKVKMSGSEKKVNRNTYNISSIKRVTRNFLEVSRSSRAKEKRDKPRPLTRVNLTTPAQFVVPGSLPRSRVFGCHVTPLRDSQKTTARETKYQAKATNYGDGSKGLCTVRELPT